MSVTSVRCWITAKLPEPPSFEKSQSLLSLFHSLSHSSSLIKSLLGINCFIALSFSLFISSCPKLASNPSRGMFCSCSTLTQRPRSNRYGPCLLALFIFFILFFPFMIHHKDSSVLSSFYCADKLHTSRITSHPRLSNRLHVPTRKY